MARNISLSTVEEIFNNLGDIKLEPKVYEQIEKELRFEGRDKRFDLFVEAGTNKSTLFKFMKKDTMFTMIIVLISGKLNII